MISIKKTRIPAGMVSIATITNKSGASVVLSNIGAGIVEVNVPARDGSLADVTLGYADMADYMADGPCAGKIPGRFANRIAKGHFVLDGIDYYLPVNNGPNCNHGGPDGFSNRLWRLVSAENDTVVFALTSGNGDAGFPGTLEVSAEYTWTDNNELKLTLSATTDAPTVVNLTNHAYWNLAGHNAGSVLGHRLRLNATHYLPTDSTLVPEGVLVPVDGTPMDFTGFKTIGRDINVDFPALHFGKGYDNCWAVADHCPGRMSLAAVLEEDASGRRLEVFTDQPGVQVYTGNWLAGSPANKAGRSYDDYDGVAIEC
ncbi:MAG: galactose mutarotase, partial [Muribaculaceae bacterium]|nr:galactose mutarotase [Muribaculaceae bacterium]